MTCGACNDTGILTYKDLGGRFKLHPGMSYFTYCKCEEGQKTRAKEMPLPAVRPDEGAVDFMALQFARAMDFVIEEIKDCFSTGSGHEGSGDSWTECDHEKLKGIVQRIAVRPDGIREHYEAYPPHLRAAAARLDRNGSYGKFPSVRPDEKLTLIDASEKGYKEFSYIVVKGDKPSLRDEDFHPEINDSPCQPHHSDNVVMQNHPYYNTAPSKEMAQKLVDAYNIVQSMLPPALGKSPDHLVMDEKDKK